MLIIQRDEFEYRISKALDLQGLMGWFGDVVYSDDLKSYSKEECYKVAFHKNTKYGHQHECRLLVDCEVEDEYILDIGDISDISKLIPIIGDEEPQINIEFVDDIGK